MTQNESFSSYSSEDSDSSTEATTTETYEIVPRENLQATLPCTFNQAQADLVENQNAQRKKRGKNKDYELQIECQSLKEAIDYINQLDSVKWTRCDTRRTKNEKADDFQFMFNCLSSLSNSINSMIYEPKYLLADAAKQITIGFELHFNYKPMRIICWAHAYRKFKNKYSKIIKDLKTRQVVQNALKKLQLAHSLDNFIVAKDLLIKQSCGESKTAIKDFFKFWLDEHNLGWFEGFAPGLPSTNNALESTNRYIKDDGTLRIRLAIRQFVSLMENGFIRDWSRERNPIDNVNLVQYQSYPKLGFETMKLAFEWSLKRLPVISKKIENKRFFFLQSSSYSGNKLDSTICNEFYQTLQKRNWSSFDSYYSHVTSIFYIDFNEADWKNSRCSCPYWPKHYICKHVIALAERLLLFEFPANVKVIPIGQKRQAGRPKNTAECLDKQPGEQISDSSDEDTYEDYFDIPVNQQVNQRVNRTSEIFEMEVLESLENINSKSPDIIETKRGRGRPKKCDAGSNSNKVASQKSTAKRTSSNNNADENVQVIKSKRRRIN